MKEPDKKSHERREIKKKGKKSTYGRHLSQKIKDVDTGNKSNKEK